jgi:hypothetical protein
MRKQLRVSSASRSKACCRARVAIVAALARTTACSLRRCCGSHALAAPGETCRPSSGAGTARTSALPAGRARACGNGCLLHWPKSDDFARCSSTRPSFAPTSMPLAPPKKRRPSARPLAWRIDHQDPCRGRCDRQAHSGPTHRGAGSRRDTDPGAAARCAGPLRGSGQGLRRAGAATDDRRGWSQSGDSAARQSPRADPLEQGNLPSPQPRRALLLSHQALPPHRRIATRHAPRATRYDKLAERFASFVCLVGTIVCIR